MRLETCKAEDVWVHLTHVHTEGGLLGELGLEVFLYEGVVLGIFFLSVCKFLELRRVTSLCVHILIGAFHIPAVESLPPASAASTERLLCHRDAGFAQFHFC